MKQTTKNSILIIGFLLAVLFAYQFSFSKTLETKSRLDSLKLQIDQSKLGSQNILGLRSKETYLDSIIENNRNESTSLQNNLLNILNKNSLEYSFKIINFKEPHFGVSPDSTHITSFQFTLEGKYKDLEELLYKLENEHSLGSLSHISFEKKKDYRLNKTFLQCSMILQNVE